MTWPPPSPNTAVEYATQRITVVDSGCWHWTGSQWSNGYGQANFNGRRFQAHRFVFEQHKGAIPDGLVLDHLCRNIICVNPDHLEPVTHAVNLGRGMAPTVIIARSGSCAQGHRMEGDNIYTSPSGARRCRACLVETRRRRYLRHKAENNVPDRRPQGGCNEPDCERVHYGRGLCKMHYQRAAKSA